jgi:kumamolisin
MTGSDTNRVGLVRSARDVPADATRARAVAPDQTLKVSVIIRRRRPLRLAELERHLTREEYLATYAADPADFDAIRTFARRYDLVVDEAVSSLARRTIVLRGATDAMEKAFGVELYHYIRDAGGEFFGYAGEITVPTEIAPMIEAVLGLDRRAVATPHIVIGEADSSPGGGKGFTAPEMAALYSFPTGSGRDQSVGVLELGGGYTPADMKTYFDALGMKVPRITDVSVDGDGENSPGQDQKADNEVALDLQVIGSIVPDARIAVYFASGIFELVDALSTAVHDAVNSPTVISVSWGVSDLSEQGMAAMFEDECQSAAALGVTVLASTGDEGATNGEPYLTVQAPASCPHVLACGGTTISVKGGVIVEEKVWNNGAKHATGGGVSSIFPVPTWQSVGAIQIKPVKGAAAPPRNRALPDVAGNADSNIGYKIYRDGTWHVAGGTSAVAPLWAALITICNELTHSAAGFVNQTLYNDKGTAFRDIIHGDNAGYKQMGYEATVGWDGCTGLGSPYGLGVAKLLGVPGVGAQPYGPVSALQLHNGGAFVTDIHALYKSPNAVSWHEQPNKENFPVGQTKTMTLLEKCKDPAIQPGWLVKLKVWVEAGDDHTAGETFVFAEDGPVADYKITGTTLDNSLIYEGG